MRQVFAFRSPFLAALLLAAVVPGAGTVRAAAPQNATAAPQDDELEALRRALAQPGGGEARREREAAVDALLRRREPAAHELLAAVIHRGADADGTAAYVLRSLDKTINQPAGTVFADPNLRGIVLRTYLEQIVRLFATDPPLVAEEAAAPLRLLARRVLARLTFLDRRDRFEELLAAGDLALARATLCAAGASRDVALIEWIAARLDDPKLAPAARAALADLTFAEEPFVDRAAFDAWAAQNPDPDYLEFAERAAQRGEEQAARLRAEAEERFVAQTAKLIAALARAEAPDWKIISAELAAAPSESATRTYLQVLRDALSARIESGAKLGGTVQDRQAFAREIRLRLEGLADSPAAFAVYLETLAYLAVREDATQRKAVEDRLLESLQMPDAEVRRAACRGLRRYPSVPNREAVVTAASAALGAGDDDMLREALGCLGAASWTAPSPGDPDREAWLLLLREVLKDAELDIRLRERALDIAVLRDAHDALVDAVFELLAERVRDPAADPSLRRQALPRMFAFTRDPGHADAYVRTALALLEDPDPGVRRAAAHQLGTLPEATQTRRAEWLAVAVERASRRLLEETDEAVLRELRDCMLGAADVPDVGQKVLDSMLATAAVLVERASPDDALRRELVVEGLRVLGVSRARDTRAWLAAADALAALRARDALLSVLERKTVAGPTDVEDLPAAEREDAVARALRLAITAARMKPAGRRWSELAAEAERVRAAFDGLDALGRGATAPGDRALRVGVLSALGRPVEVVAAGTAALADREAPLGAEQTSAVLRAVVQAQIELGALDDAEARLVELEGLAAGSVDGAADLWTGLAARRLAAGKAAAAAEILDRVLPRTSPEDPAWRERFLLRAEARLGADPDAYRKAVLDELTAEEARFAGEGVPPAQAARFAELLIRARGQG